MWAIVVVCVAVVVGLVAIYIQYYDTGFNDNGLNESNLNVAGNLYVAEATMMHKTDRYGNSLVVATIGIENRGNGSQNLDGYVLKASFIFEGVLMDKEILSLNGTLGANSTASRRFEFFPDKPLNSGNAVKIWVAIEDEDANVLAFNDFYFNIP